MEQDLEIGQRLYIAINGAITEANIHQIIWNGEEYTYRCHAPCHLPWISKIWHKRKDGDYDQLFTEPRGRVFKNLEELNNYLIRFETWFK